MLTETHVGYRLPIACGSLAITGFLPVARIGLYVIEKPQGYVQGLPIATGSIIFAEAIDDKSDCIELLLGVKRSAIGVKAPVGSPELIVNKKLNDIVARTLGGFEIIGILRSYICRRKSP